MFQNKILDDSEYCFLKTEYDNRIKEIDQQMEELKTIEKSYSTNFSVNRNLSSNAKKYLNSKVLMVMLSEDRRRYGIIPVRSVMENASVSCLEKFIYKGYAHEKEEKEVVSEYFQKMNVKTPSLETPIQSLSGGNQQKVLLAKWMLREPKVLILDEPTRGIDVGAKFEIYKLMTELAKQQKAVIMVSSELPELIGMCDRIYVMNQGKITGELNRTDFSQETIMKLATTTN